MNWVRLKAGRLSLVALFALALQFTLSFAHVHADPAWSSHQQTVVTTPSADTGLDADDLCAICATIAIAQTLIDAAPPALSLPAAFTRAETTPPRETRAELARQDLFWSRGPPLS